MSVPVFTSALLQVPMAAATIAPGRRIAIFTARTVLNARHFAGAGWSADDIPVVQAAPPGDSHFITTFVGNTPETDVRRLEHDVAELTGRVMRDHPDVGAIVLECANFSPFRGIVRRVSGVPVFDLYTLGMHAFATTTISTDAAGSNGVLIPGYSGARKGA